MNYHDVFRKGGGFKMLVRRYETRLNEDGLITFEKVWSKIDILVEKNEFRYPERIYELCKALRLDTYSEEHVFLLMFDTKMHFKSFIEVGIGNVSTSVIDKRGIVQKVLMLNAAAFVLVHNHPSGDSMPSAADISTAKTISELGDLIGIPFKDMMILGDGNYTSLKQDGYF